MSAFFGNMMIALRTGISATTLSAAGNTTTSSITAGVGGGRGTYTYLWSQSGTSCTITSTTSAATTFTGSGVAGTTNVFCNIRDTITGNTLNTPICVITWTAVSVSQNVVISGNVTFNGSAQAYTITGTPASPAPTGTPSTFTNVGTYVYPTNITSITPGAGYTLGSVSGSFTINRKAITTFNASYGYDSGIFLWIIFSVTFTGGVPNGTFNNFVLAIQSGGTSTDLPVNISGTFDGTGSYTWTGNPPGAGAAVSSTNPPGGQAVLRLTAGASTNYSGTLTTTLLI
jgi:hypothetical protein